MGQVWIGCAGWALPRSCAGEFPGPGTHLERYGRILPAVEINTTFYRPHRSETFDRWAASVPAGFRFSLKMPRDVTHLCRLQDCDELLASFIDASAHLGERRGPVLVQLPPFLLYDEGVARGFFESLRRLHRGPVACEPRHPSWFGPAAESMLAELQVARVAADPPRAEVDAEPGGWPGLAYLRLHGSPRTYFSAYDDVFLDVLAQRVRRLGRAGDVWLIFDNTAAGAAMGNARSLLGRLGG